MGIFEYFHNKYVLNHRVHSLSRQLAELIPADATVLDVGSGDGFLAYSIFQLRSDIQINGIDVLIRENPQIPIKRFDGNVIPYADNSYDLVMFVDVLHHTENPRVLLQEANRVAKNSILIKDHMLKGLFAYKTLAFMDRIGNTRYGVALPNNYWLPENWFDTFSAIGLNVKTLKDKLNLYPWPANTIFGRSLHFIALLEKSN